MRKIYHHRNKGEEIRHKASNDNLSAFSPKLDAACFPSFCTDRNSAQGSKKYDNQHQANTSSREKRQDRLYYDTQKPKMTSWVEMKRLEKKLIQRNFDFKNFWLERKKKLTKPRTSQNS